MDWQYKEEIMVGLTPYVITKIMKNSFYAKPVNAYGFPTAYTRFSLKTGKAYGRKLYAKKGGQDG